MLIREALEDREEKLLSPFAARSKTTKGRLKKEEECNLRTAFQRDRDKIIHSKAFRRLKHKTQVFLSPIEDHYRTRLTHALEVAQISRTIARALNLNEDLAEAIALGHDLGHTPFGHSGEDVLDYILKTFYQSHFKHNEQSLRVVDELEELNLTYEVRDGILRHPQKELAQPETLEGRIVRISDHIAYINHDLEDAVRAGVLKPEEIPKDLGENKLDAMVQDVIKESLDQKDIKMSKGVKTATDKLYDFLNARVYTNPEVKSEEGKTNHLITTLFRYYMDHPQELPVYKKEWSEKEIVKAITDFIAGMTDRYAINKFNDLYMPAEWRGKA